MGILNTWRTLGIVSKQTQFWGNWVLLAPFLKVFNDLQ